MEVTSYPADWNNINIAKIEKTFFWYFSSMTSSQYFLQHHSGIRLCSNLISSHTIFGFWVCIFTGRQYFWEYQYQIPFDVSFWEQHATARFTTIWRLQLEEVWNNKHSKPAHYSSDTFSSRASLDFSLLYNSARCSPAENVLPPLKSTQKRLYAFRRRLAVREKHLRCQVWSHTSGAFLPQKDYCGLINAGTQNDSMFMRRFLYD